MKIEYLGPLESTSENIEYLGPLEESKPMETEPSFLKKTANAAKAIFQPSTLESIGRATGTLASIPVMYPASGVAGLFEATGKTIGESAARLLAGEGLYSIPKAFEGALSDATRTIETVGSLPSQTYLGAPKVPGQKLDVMSFAPQTTDQSTPEQQVVSIVGIPFEKLAELNAAISGKDSAEPPSAIRYALGAVPEALLYTVGFGGLAKYGSKAITSKRMANILERRNRVAEKANIPQAAPQAGTPSSLDKLTSPVSTKDRRRRERSIPKSVEEEVAEQVAKQESFQAKLKGEQDKALEGQLIIEDEAETAFSKLDQTSKDFIVQKVKELGSFEAVAKVYDKQDPVSIFARETAKTIYEKGGEQDGLQGEAKAEVIKDKTSVQNLNKARLTEEEWKTLRDQNVFTDEELASLAKAPGFKQREQYNRTMNIVPEAPALTPEEAARIREIQDKVTAAGRMRKSRVQDLATLREFGYTEAQIKAMSAEDVQRKAAIARGEELKLGVNENNVEKLTEAEAKIRALVMEDVDITKMTPEELDAYEARLDEVTKDLVDADIDEVFDPLERKSIFDEVDEDGISKMSYTRYMEIWNKLAAALAKGERKRAKTTKVDRRRRPIMTEEEVDKIEATEEPLPGEGLEEITQTAAKRAQAERLAEKARQTGSADDWEATLAAEGMPAELNFDQQAKTRVVREYYQSRKAASEEAKAIVLKRISDAKSGREPIRTNIDARNLLVKTYQHFPTTKAEALEWIKTIQEVEDLTTGLIEHKRSAFSRKAIAKALDQGLINKPQAAYMNTIFNTLKQQPTFGFDVKSLTKEHGLYELARNLMEVRDSKALAHEVGHWAFYNVLTSAERVEYIKHVAENYYNEAGELSYRRLTLATTDPFNAVKNPSELFAAKLSDYTLDKVLSPREKTLFQNVISWFSQLKDALLKKVGVDYSGVEKIFEKVMSRTERRFWSESEIGTRPVMLENEVNPMSVLGLKEAADRARYLINQWKTANKKLPGDRILAEVQGPDWGLAEAKARAIKSTVDAITMRQALYQNIGPYIASPMEFAKGTRLEPHVFNTNLAEMHISYLYDKHATEIRNAEKGLSKESKIRVTKYLRDKMNKKEDTVQLTPQEQASADGIRDWLEVMRAKYKNFRLNEFKNSLNKTEYNALVGLISGNTPESIAIKYPKINNEVIAQLLKEYKAIDEWGIDDYIPNVESGRFKMYTNEVTEGGKPYRKLIGIGLSEKDAIRKATRYLEENPNVGDIYIGTDFKVLMDDKTSITMKQYGAMLGSLSKRIQEALGEIEKGVAKDLAAKTLKRKFKIIPTDAFSPFLLEKSNVFVGEENIFPVLRSYAHSMEKKMNLDPVIDRIKADMKNMNEREKDYILDYIEDVKGRYGRADKFVDDLLMSMANTGMMRRLGISFGPYRSYSRAVTQARKLEANIKLGYRPVAAFVNMVSGQGHTWVKSGAKTYTEAVQFLMSPEGKAFVKDIEPVLGVSVMDIGEAVKAKTEVWKPLGLFQKPEPFNREVSAAAGYLMAKKRGLSHEAAMEEALRSVWSWQFTYNVANLPKLMRGPTGKLVLQFKPYLVKELEFMSNLTAKEWLRYTALQLSLAGPRGAIMIARTLPALALLGWWQEAMDTAEEYMNKEWPLLSRGIGGLPGLIKPEYGVDISAPATFQFPSGAMDIVGPTLSDISKVFTKVVGPMSEYGPFWEDIIKAGDVIPIMKHWKKVWDYAVSDDNWIRDEQGNKLYEIKSGAALIAQSLAGTESIDANRIRTEQRILARRDEKFGGIKTRVLNQVMNSIINGEPIPQSTIDLMFKYNISGKSIQRRIKTSELPPDLRAVLMTEMARRPEVMDMFPTEEDYE